MARGPALQVDDRILPISRRASLVGRVDPASGAVPDIDLTELDVRRAVSRRHAELTFSEGVAAVRDIGSTNGTWVAGDQIPPLVPRTLNDGAALSFGGVEATYVLDAEWPPGVMPEWAGETVVLHRSDSGFATPAIPAAGAEPVRILATVLFTDIFGSTVRLAQLGDRGWLDLLQQHMALARANLRQFGGREVDHAGDGFFATFASPEAAIHCALAIRAGAGTLGIQVRSGLHAGECLVTAEVTGGLAVHIASRVESRATPDEVWVTATVKELVAGSGFAFQDRGARSLKGVPGKWRLFSVETP